MLNNPAAIRSLRTWRRRVLATTLLVGLGLAIARLRAHLPDTRLVEACRIAARDARPDAAAQLRVAGVCLTAFVWSHDPASGARAARALAGRAGSRWIVEWLALDIGDRAADAWFALGRARRMDDAAASAVAAYERALAHRASDDVAGQLRDINGVMAAYRATGDLERASLAGARAYTLSARGGMHERSMTLINVADLMRELGSAETSKRLLDGAAAFTMVTDPGYPVFQQTLGLVEQALGHPKVARTALRAAHAAAIRLGTSPWTIYLDLLDLELEQGDVAAATVLMAHPPEMPDVANNRAAVAYYRARLQVAQGQLADAVATTEQALAHAPRGWALHLEAIRGSTLMRLGATAGAEQALRHAVRAAEDQRSQIDNDTLKSWSLARRRAPFEDLFLLYVQQGRTRDALEVAQRATARSVLDGLLAQPIAPRALDTEIVDAGVRATGLRALARSLRASPSAEVPPIASILERLRGHHVVTYFRVRHELWAIAVRRDASLVAHRVGEVDPLDRAIAAWLGHPQRDDLGEQLGMALLPDELMPAAGEALYVVPDGPVREVMFAALRRHGAYVVEHNPVGYALSAASLSVVPRPEGTGRAVVIGDPLGDLPSARVEAIEVAGSLGVTPYLGRDATRAVLGGASEAWLLHVAAHTDPTASGPAIHLADAPLDAATVLERPISARLVMLLGCSSARAQGHDELAPLASAFIAAGARTVVASLWAVDDTVARQFAHEFYTLGGIDDSIRALAMAQRQLMRDGVPVDQWSTFVVFGGLRDKRQGQRE